MPKQLATIVQIRQETSSVKILALKLSVPFDFKPGQFVMITIPGYVDKTSKGLRRAYSIASSPNAEFLELVIKINPAPSLSSEIDKLQISNLVEIDGPYGKFVLEKISSDVLFVAGGTGIAPLLSMILYCCHLQNRPLMQLLFGVKQVQDIIYRKELDALQKQECLNVVYCLSQEKREGFVQGRVTSVLAQYVKPSQDVYVCGSPEFVHDTITVLESVGVLKERIHKEQW